MVNSPPSSPTLTPIPTSSVSASERRRTARTNDNIAGQLEVVRTNAANWGKGLAGILTAIIGFGLIKGPAEISSLQRLWAVAVGLLLAVALICGMVAAFRLMRGAFGGTKARTVEAGGITSTEEKETADSVAALNHGIRAALGALVFLMLAVGTTWYGPKNADPVIRVGVEPGENFVCGNVTSVNADTMEVETAHGTQHVLVRTITTLSAIESCP